MHPADLDDAFCTSGAMAVRGGGETQLPFAVDDAQLQGAPGELWAVRIVASGAKPVRLVVLTTSLSCLYACRLWRVKAPNRSQHD